MYSEQIDTIEQGLESYANDLRHIVKKICKKIANIGKKNSIDVVYYTDSEVQPYYFAIDGYNGVPESSYIGQIDDLNTLNPVFRMRSEERGDVLGVYTVDDFNTSDILGVCRMLNDILNVVQEDKEVHD